MGSETNRAPPILARFVPTSNRGVVFARALLNVLLGAPEERRKLPEIAKWNFAIKLKNFLAEFLSEKTFQAYFSFRWNVRVWEHLKKKYA